MEGKRSWWQKARKPLEIFGIIVVCILIFALLAVIIIVYVFNVNVPGLRGKTLWDWLQLLIIPLVLAVIALVFQLANSRTERQIAKQRYEQDQQLALDKQREDLLQAYLDRMSDLILKEGLRSSNNDAEVRNVARVRTITILFQLDARRIGIVFAFLRETELMANEPNRRIVNFDKADLRNINLSQTNLRGADLRGADLEGANLSQADLRGADLSEAKLTLANLSKSNLNFTELRGARLDGANFSEALLSGANLSDANLSGANLSFAKLGGNLWASRDYSPIGANLSGAHLRYVDFSGADLEDVDFSGADLCDTKVTPEQLNRAKSLKGATMPDCSLYP